MPISKIKTSSILADAASTNLNIDAGTLFLDATNNRVGVGTTSPTRQLQVSNASNAIVSALNGSIEGVLNATTTNVNVGSASNHFVTLATNGTERVRIDTSGNVGIGTDTMTSLLNVNGDVRVGNGGDLRISNSSSPTTVANDTFLYNDGATPTFITWVNGAERMRITSAGDVGIGTTTIGTKLVVAGTGQSLSGTAYNVADFTNSGQTLGTRIGYDSSNGAVIASSGVDKPIAFWQYNTANYLERMRLDSSGNLLLGTTAINRLGSGASGPAVHLAGSAGVEMYLSTASTTSGDTAGAINFGTTGTSSAAKRSALIGSLLSATSSSVVSGNLVFYTNSAGTLAERMRISSGGQVCIGGTSARGKLDIESNGVASVVIGNPNELTVGTVIIGQNIGGCALSLTDGANAHMYLEILSGYGSRIRSDNHLVLTSGGVDSAMKIASTSGTVTLGSYAIMTSDAGSLSIGNGNVGLLLLANTGQRRIIPRAPNSVGTAPDNAIDLGDAGSRFSVIYATTGSINTSDRNEKQDIQDFSDAEKRVAVKIKSLFKTFRWKDSVVKKGDDARIHAGVIAQDVRDAFTSEGLDANRYALFCSDTWYTVDGRDLKDNGERFTAEDEGAVEHTRLGMRYSELLSFVISAL
jgi:hypothetical protein